MRAFSDFFSVVPLRTPTLPPATHTNCVLVGGIDALVVDPGSAFPKELALLHRRVEELLAHGGSLAGVLLTHHHKDHVGGAAELARRYDLPVLAHPETLNRLPDLSGLPKTPVHHGRTVASEGDHRAVALLTPGHAPGHLCLWDERDRTLVAGDVVAGEGTIVIDPPEGDMAQYLATLARLRDLNPRTLIPAHGDPIPEGKQALGMLMDHRMQREQKVLSALDHAPRDVAELVPAAYDDTSPLAWPLAARSALAHLLKLEAEGRARRTADDRWRLTAQSAVR